MADVVKLAVTLALALTGCSSCTPASSPTAPTDQTVTAELVEAGATKLISGSAVLDAENPREVYEELSS